MIELTHPRSRLSRSETRSCLYTGLGELLWYLSRSNQLDFIKHYIPKYEKESDDGLTVYGGYGTRLFNHHGVNQLQNVIEKLKTNGSSRRAVIQLFDAADLVGTHKEIPCTTTLQFFVRSGRLNMIATMRSNDAWFGLPHDVFCFTMLQEIVARTLGLGLGRYRHYAGSLHLYEEYIEQAEQYLGEGVQGIASMPKMPIGNPWKQIAVVQEAERRIRNGLTLAALDPTLDPYWADIIRLLRVLASTGNRSEISSIGRQIAHAEYAMYVESQKRKKARPTATPAQYELPF